ncbi:MAG: hypothetical protein SAJ11_06915 [Jaaginema sp. PMC 1078.18]|nr:hypothetical protein [Jaaginema sp. PMC 1078.18]
MKKAALVCLLVSFGFFQSQYPAYTQKTAFTKVYDINNDLIELPLDSIYSNKRHNTQLKNLPVNLSPIFQPLLPTIRDTLPSHLKLRLPSYMPAISGNIYPYVDPDFVSPDSFSITLGNQPRCDFHACAIGLFTVSRNITVEERLVNLRAMRQSVEAVNLKNNNAGFYSINQSGGSGYGWQSVFWQQNGLIYEVSLRHQDISRQNIIDIANSMVQTPPLN